MMGAMPQTRCSCCVGPYGLRRRATAALSWQPQSRMRRCTSRPTFSSAGTARGSIAAKVQGLTAALSSVLQ